MKEKVQVEYLYSFCQKNKEMGAFVQKYRYNWQVHKENVK